MSAMRRDGFVVTRAHGYIFQRLLRGDSTITALAEALGMTQQGASKHVGELERLGLVTRRVSTDDRRARNVSLTEAGLAAIESARAARRRFDARLLSLLGEDDVARLRRVLAAVLDDAGDLERIADRSIRWRG